MLLFQTLIDKGSEATRLSFQMKITDGTSMNSQRRRFKCADSKSLDPHMFLSVADIILKDQFT
jgi:hypothetical protein